MWSCATLTEYRSVASLDKISANADSRLFTYSIELFFLSRAVSSLWTTHLPGSLLVFDENQWQQRIGRISRCSTSPSVFPRNPTQGMQTVFSFVLAYGAILCEASASDIISRGCQYSKMAGALNESFLAARSINKRKIAAHSEMECVMTTCDCSTRCIASFYRPSGTCLSATITSLPLEWLKQCDLLIDASDGSWATYISSQALTSEASERPSALWLLDDMFRGCNLGSKGRQLDCSETGVTWDAVGPLGKASRQRFARLDNNSRPVIEVSHEGQFLLNFNQSFTMMVWVKTDDVPPLKSPILDGISKGNQSLQMWFWPGANQSQIFVGHVRSFSSEIKAEGRLQWRHLSLVYANDYKLFLNASKWEILSKYHAAKAAQPDILTVGFRFNDRLNYYQGSMACIAIFERALQIEKIESFMNYCPRLWVKLLLETRKLCTFVMFKSECNVHTLIHAHVISEKV